MCEYQVTPLLVRSKEIEHVTGRVGFDNYKCTIQNNSFLHKKPSQVITMLAVQVKEKEKQGEVK